MPYQTPAGWDVPLDTLRRKWNTIPAGNDQRSTSTGLLAQSDDAVLAHWDRAFRHDTEGEGFGVRGWYHELYRDFVPGKKILDVGCGMGISTLHFAKLGARVTFTDIIRDNVELVRRLCAIKGIEAEFLYLEAFEDFLSLDADYDVVTAIGSLINTPLAVTKHEVDLIKTRLRPGGRWLHFAYPKSRWAREGAVELAQWGEMTDGPGTPWMEWHDREKIDYLFAPSQIRVLFDCEWHNNDFNWFDIQLLSH